MLTKKWGKSRNSIVITEMTNLGVQRKNIVGGLMCQQTLWNITTEANTYTYFNFNDHATSSVTLKCWHNEDSPCETRSFKFCFSLQLTEALLSVQFYFHCLLRRITSCFSTTLFLVARVTSDWSFPKRSALFSLPPVEV